MLSTSVRHLIVYWFGDKAKIMPILENLRFLLFSHFVILPPILLQFFNLFLQKCITHNQIQLQNEMKEEEDEKLHSVYECGLDWTYRYDFLNRLFCDADAQARCCCCCFLCCCALHSSLLSRCSRHCASTLHTIRLRRKDFEIPIRFVWLFVCIFTCCVAPSHAFLVTTKLFLFLSNRKSDRYACLKEMPSTRMTSR